MVDLSLILGVHRSMGPAPISRGFAIYLLVLCPRLPIQMGFDLSHLMQCSLLRWIRLSRFFA